MIKCNQLSTDAGAVNSMEETERHGMSDRFHGRKKSVPGSAVFSLRLSDPRIWDQLNLMGWLVERAAHEGAHEGALTMLKIHLLVFL